MPEVQGIGVAPPVAGSAGKAAVDAVVVVGGNSAHARSRWTKSFVYVGFVLIAASIAIYFFFRSASHSAPSHAESETALNLDTFIVNLEGGNQRAYLRVGITLGLSQPLAQKGAVPVAPLRDAIVTVLSSAQPQQLLTSEGKQKVKEDLLKALQERAPALGIENVYFTEFLVQM
jgi:flagellar basal body-associated protein FliL